MKIEVEIIKQKKKVLLKSTCSSCFISPFAYTQITLFKDPGVVDYHIKKIHVRFDRLFSINKNKKSTTK